MTSEGDWDRVIAQTEDEHVAIVKALHKLDDALLSPSTQAWVTHVDRALTGLIETLQQHAAAVTSSGGMFALIDLHGHSRGLTELARTHDKLRHDALSLLEALRATPNPEARYSPVRRDAAFLAAAVRRHEAEESALIYETSVRVSGGEG